MPQLVPFYFSNQTICMFLLFTFVMYIFSKYILPRFPRLYTTRGILYID